MLKKELLKEGQQQFYLQGDLICCTMSKKLPFACGTYLLSDLSQKNSKKNEEISKTMDLKKK